MSFTDKCHMCKRTVTLYWIEGKGWRMTEHEPQDGAGWNCPGSHAEVPGPAGD